MSEPTAQDPLSRRPLKKMRSSTNQTPSATATPQGQQAASITTLFARHSDGREIALPPPPTSAQQKSSLMPPPPEIVANVQGSSAGAGSGEFHVYKASRRREYERLRLMDEEVKKESEQAEWEAKRRDVLEKEERRREKNRKKRGKGRDKDGPKSKGGKENGLPGAVTKEKAKIVIRKIDGGSDDQGGLDDDGAERQEEVGVTIHDDD
ncbi:hypothetical protein MMC25_007410 [Agyrium rufum]|nr:hypothetical protein [Agyrium rufum]